MPMTEGLVDSTIEQRIDIAVELDLRAITSLDFRAN